MVNTVAVEKLEDFIQKWAEKLIEGEEVNKMTDRGDDGKESIVKMDEDTEVDDSKDTEAKDNEDTGAEDKDTEAEDIKGTEAEDNEDGNLLCIMI